MQSSKFPKIGLAPALDQQAVDLARVIRYVQQSMNTDIVSYWKVEGDASARSATRIACHDARNPNALPVDMPPSRGGCEQYLRLVHSLGVVSSPDVLDDERLDSIREAHLRPAGIRSLVSAGVLVNATLVAVLSSSRRDCRNRWSLQDCLFMRRAAVQISLHHARQHAQFCSATASSAR
jgi:hypothetical protein